MSYITPANPAGNLEQSPLLRIMYSSVVAEAQRNLDLNSLLAQSAANNSQRGITGVLMVDGRLIIQYLEGPEAAVRQLWQRICEDRRHHLIVQLYEDFGLLPRLFGQWAMLRGQTSREEMLSLIRDAHRKSDKLPRPAWSLAMAPLIILLDSDYNRAYAEAVL